MHSTLERSPHARGRREHIPTSQGVYSHELQQPEKLLGTVVLSRISGDPYKSTFALGTFGDIQSFDQLLSARVLAQVTKSDQWRAHVFNRDASTDVDMLTETVEAAIDFISEYGPTALNIRGLNPENVQCEHLAALLRATSMWRNEIPGWNEALVIAQRATEIAGLESEDVLFGML